MLTKQRSLFPIWVVGLLVLLILPLDSLGQETTGNISGTVSDPSGAVIPNAAVAATNVLTAARRATSTTSAGLFYFSRLPIGEYRLTVEVAGFKTYEATGIRLNVNEKLNFPITLQIGEVSDRVTVTGEAGALQTETGEVSNLVGADQVRDLPLNGRNFAQLVDLVPGVSPDNGRVGGRTGLSADTAVSINGNRSNANLWLLDGQYNMEPGYNGGNVVTPSVDSIEEFKVLRNNFSAEFGQVAGGVINVVTKSGTRDFHGTAFEFGRNDALDAADFFLNKTAQPKSKLRQHDFGFTAGGPFFIPGKYNAERKKDFFFVSYEGRREIRGGVAHANVPSVRQRQGIIDPNCKNTPAPCAVQPLDPMEVPLFRANRNVNPSQFDPNARAILARWPLPNTSYVDNGFNWIASNDLTTKDTQAMVRWDHNFGEKATLMVRYLQGVQSLDNINGQFWGDDAFPSVNSDWSNKGRNAVITLTNTLTPRLLNEFQFGHTYRDIIFVTGKSSDPKLASRDGFTYTEWFPETSGTFPRIRDVESIYGLQHQAPYYHDAKVFHFKDNLSYTFGTHNLKTGVYFGKNRNAEYANGGRDRTPGTIRFRSFENMLRGILRSYEEEETTNSVHNRFNDLSFYVQDNWKVRPGLTLDYGLRWQYMGQSYSARDNIANFYPSLYNPSRCSVAAFDDDGRVDPTRCDPLNGIVTPGSPNAPNRALVDNHFNEWEPRFGLAWVPWGSKRLVIRAGAGIYHARDANSITSQLGVLPPYNHNAFLAGLTFSDLAPGRLSPFNPNTPQAPLYLTGALDKTFYNPQSQQYSLGFQYEIRPETTLEINYVGSHQIHQARNRDLNQVPEKYRHDVAEFLVNPDLVRPYLGYNVIFVNERAGASRYNSLQTFFNHRMRKGVQFQAAYTYSTLITNTTNQDSEANNGPVYDALRPDLEKSFAPQDQRHSVTFNYTWHLPFFTQGRGLKKSLLGGWQLIGITTFRAGLPLTPCTDDDIAGVGSFGCQRVNVIAPVNLPGSQRTLERYFNTGAFVLQKLGTTGNAGRYILRGPGVNNWDFSIFKSFQIREKVNLQFRADFFNGWNHTQFSSVNTSFYSVDRVAGGPVDPSASFGQIDGARAPREIQLGLKLIW